MNVACGFTFERVKTLTSVQVLGTALIQSIEGVTLPCSRKTKSGTHSIDRISLSPQNGTKTRGTNSVELAN